MFGLGRDNRKICSGKGRLHHSVARHRAFGYAGAVTAAAVLALCAPLALAALAPEQAHAASATPISKCKISLGKSSFTYTGGTINPLPDVKHGKKTLKKGMDYTLSYSKDHTNVGSCKVFVKGKKAYKGSKAKSFKITPAPMTAATASVSGSCTYTGSALTPGVKASFNSKALSSGKDFTLSYSDNVNAGTAKAMLTGKGNFSGVKPVEFKIDPADISVARVTLGLSGSSIVPKVSWNGRILSLGDDYTAAYEIQEGSKLYDLESLRKLGPGANKIVMAFNQLRAKYGQHFENKTLAAYYKSKSWYEDQSLDIGADSLTGDAKKTYKALKKLAREECPELYKKLCK